MLVQGPGVVYRSQEPPESQKIRENIGANWSVACSLAAQSPLYCKIQVIRLHISVNKVTMTAENAWSFIIYPRYKSRLCNINSTVVTWKFHMTPWPHKCQTSRSDQAYPLIYAWYNLMIYEVSEVIQANIQIVKYTRTKKIAGRFNSLCIKGLCPSLHQKILDS